MIEEGPTFDLNLTLRIDTFTTRCHYEKSTRRRKNLAVIAKIVINIRPIKNICSKFIAFIENVFAAATNIFSSPCISKIFFSVDDNDPYSLYELHQPRHNRRARSPRVYRIVNYESSPRSVCQFRRPRAENILGKKSSGETEGGRKEELSGATDDRRYFHVPALFISARNRSPAGSDGALAETDADPKSAIRGAELVANSLFPGIGRAPTSVPRKCTWQEIEPCDA